MEGMARTAISGARLISRIENWDIRRSYCGDSISPKTTPVFPVKRPPDTWALGTLGSPILGPLELWDRSAIQVPPSPSPGHLWGRDGTPPSLLRRFGTAANFPEHFMLENLAVRADGSSDF